MTAKNPWHPYSVGALPTRRGIYNSNCSKFGEVSHTAHVQTALDIVRDGIFRSRLVYDESILNMHRLPVVWLSPNAWDVPGSRYGSVEFWFDWKKLIAETKFYWVEAITRYSPPAPRILITSMDRTNLPVVRYDPGDCDGPWAYNKSDDTHYRNGEYTLEFMYESDIRIDSVQKITFVKHSPKYCSIKREKPALCEERGLLAEHACVRFISGLMARNLKKINRCFRIGNVASDDLRHFNLHSLSLSYDSRDEFSGSTKGDTDLGRALARSFFHFQSLGEHDTAKTVMLSYKSNDEFNEATMKVIADHFDVTAASLA